MRNDEFIVYAAIKDQNGTIHTGRRHHIIFGRLKYLKITHIGAVQGFVTNMGRFVDRKDALVIALSCGQATPPIRGDNLYSEDIY